MQPQANSYRDASVKSHSECWGVSHISTLPARSGRAWLAASFRACPSRDKGHRKGARSQAHAALCTSGSRGFGGPRAVGCWKPKLDNRGIREWQNGS